MDRNMLADRIAATPLAPNGQEDHNPASNPILVAYYRYPRVRRIIDDSPYNTYDDALRHTVTADISDQIMRTIRNQR